MINFSGLFFPHPPAGIIQPMNGWRTRWSAVRPMYSQPHLILLAGVLCIFSGDTKDSAKTAKKK
jgi:hypothetical protein